MSLDERYGRRPARVRRPVLLAGLAVFAAVAVAWLVWAALGLAGSNVTWHDVAVDASDPAAVRVSFEVTQPAGRAAVCSVRATARDGGIVGWVDVPVAASATGTRAGTVTVRTSRPAADGGVVTCVRR